MSDWTAGERLHARGHAWILLHTERGVDCTAAHLAREPDPAITATLISPFDRFVRAGCIEKPTVVRARHWCEAVRRLAATCHPAGSLRALPFAKIELLPHQLEPALAVFRLGATRVLIADAVGLGKTIQAGLIAAELVARARSTRGLILVPAGLRDQWAVELSKHFQLDCIRADAAWLAAASGGQSIGVNPWSLPGLFLASFDFVKRAEVLRPLEDVSWDLVVLDEAHAASAASDRRSAANAIATRARIVVLLTATPPADNPAEYESLRSIGRLDAREGPVWLFRRSQRGLGIRSRRKSRFLMVRPSDAEMRMHGLLEEYTSRVWRESQARGDERARLAAVVLRKRALSSAAALARSVRRRLELLLLPPRNSAEQLRLPIWDEDPLEDDQPEAVLAAPGLADAAIERRWLSLIAETAQGAAASETKLRFLSRMLARVREPVIVFTEYRDTLTRLKDALTNGVRILMLLHGGMRPSERTAVQQEFNGGPASKESTRTNEHVVLLATDAAAEGLNLHERCRTVIHFELPWSTTRLEQRAGRVDRLGQSRPVHEIAFVSATTAERLVLEPLIRRVRNARAAGFGTEGLPAVLGESHVAEMILAGRSRAAETDGFSPAPIQSSSIRTGSLNADAVVEAERTRGIRSLAAADQTGAALFRPARPLASAIKKRRSQLPTGAILVYLIELHSRESQLHAELVTLWLAPAPEWHAAARHAQTARLGKAESVRAILDRLRIGSAPQVVDLLSSSARRALDHTTRIHDLVNREWNQRVTLMQTARRSAASQLVQQGLFERRTSRSTPAENAYVPPEDAGDAPPGLVVSIETRLVAALVVAP